MPSPFPGMDPYLEGEEWHDVHQRLATQISNQLSQLIRPRYIARLALATAADITTQQEIEVMYPDVEVLRRRRDLTPSSTLGLAADGVLTTAAPITKAVIAPLPVLRLRLVTVEIRETDSNRLVTSIEVISPVNKRKPGLTKFQEKRERLIHRGVHLLDIDFIRRGKRPVELLRTFAEVDEVDQAPYLVTLTRAKSTKLELWPIYLQESLPIVAVPLRTPDPDVPLDLGKALTTIYDEALYDLSIDYSQPPPPPRFDEKTQAWIDELLKATRVEESRK